MNRVQLILSLDLLLRLLSCKPLLPSDCLHCLKTPTNLSNSITLSNTFVGSTSVTSNCKESNCKEDNCKETIITYTINEIEDKLQDNET
jgi:hypothetical protein